MAKRAAATKKKAPKNEVSMETKTTVKTVTVSGKQSFGKHLEGALSSRTLWRALAAEVIGTFLLASVILASQGSPIFVLFGLGGLASDGDGGGLGSGIRNIIFLQPLRVVLVDPAGRPAGDRVNRRRDQWHP